MLRNTNQRNECHRISVIMSVFNADLFLNDSINSILNQTFKDFEFIIVDDCSTDDSYNIIRTYKDSRIILIRNNTNLGLAKSLNIAIKQSIGEYIVRMDADDISYENRLEVLIKFMDKNPSIGVAGSYFKLFGDVHWYKKIIVRKGKISQDEIRSQLLFGPCVLHPSVIIRKKVLINNNIFYNESFYRAQDYELWTRLIKVTRITNVPKVLMKWRISHVQSSVADRSKQIDYSREIHKNILTELKGVPLSDFELDMHQWVISKKNLSEIELKHLENWFLQIIEYSRINQFFCETTTRKECSFQFFNVCLKSKKGLGGFLFYVNSDLYLCSVIQWKHYVMIIVKTIFFI